MAFSTIFLQRRRTIFDVLFASLIEKALATWPRAYKTILSSTQLSMKFFLLLNVKMPIIVREKNSILELSEPEKKSEFLDIFILMSI